MPITIETRRPDDRTYIVNVLELGLEATIRGTTPVETDERMREFLLMLLRAYRGAVLAD